MKNVLLKIEYLGTHYKGWQIQPNAFTVEEQVKKAFEQIVRRKIAVKASSRTDAGVHAKGQTATVLLPETVILRRLFSGVNALLPNDIAVTDMVRVPEDFSARKYSIGKRYIYQIFHAPIQRAISNELYLWKRGKLDLNKMCRISSSFVGTHDFSAFQGKGCQQPNTIKTITKIDIVQKKLGNFSEIMIIIEGSGFLKNMIRIMVGTLLEIASGKLDENAITKALTSGLREDAGITIPAKGLILDKVFFNPDPFEQRIMETWDSEE